MRWNSLPTALVTRTVVALLAAFACIGTTNAEEPLQTLDEIAASLDRFDVTGQVVDRDGKPIKGAEVFLYYARGGSGLRSRLMGRATTKRQGHFVFKKAGLWEPTPEVKETPRQRYYILAKHPDHGIDFTMFFPEDACTDLAITLHGVEMWPVTVKDADGNPVEGARVFVRNGRHVEEVHEAIDRKYRYFNLTEDIGLSSAVTDADGNAELMGPADAGFRIEKPGYADAYTDDNALMFPSAGVSGTVTFDDGSPAKGVAVWYNYQGNRLINTEVRVTDDEGKYDFEDLPAAGYRYSWMDPETEKGARGRSSLLAEDLRPGSPFVGKLVSLSLSPGDDVTQDLVLERGCVLAGQVVDITTGKPVPRMHIRRRFSGDYGEFSADDEGRFSVCVAPGSEVRLSFERSREGDYLIDQEWSRRGGSRAFEETVLESREELVLEVKLVPVAPLEGKVVDSDGNPVPEASVYIHMEAPGVKTDENGQFTLTLAPTDKDYALLAVSKDEDLAAVVELAADTGETTITLEPTRDFDGVVTNTEGLPAANLQFYLDAKINDSTIFRVRREPHTDANGKFKAEKLVPKATYYAWWSCDHDENRDYSYGNASLDLSELAPGDPITFEAAQYLNTLMGRVVDEAGQPVKGARIDVRGNLLAQDAPRQVITDDDGAFTIQRLAPGDVSLGISAEEYRTATVQAATDSIDFEAVLKPKRSGEEGTLCEVTVVDDDGKPVPGIPINLYFINYHEEGAPEPVLQEDAATTNADGLATFVVKVPEGMRSGNGIVGCSIEGWDHAYHGANAREDMSAKLVLHKSGEHWAGRVEDVNGNPLGDVDVVVHGMVQGDPGQGVEAYAFTGKIESESLPSFAFRTDEKGDFVLKGFSKRDNVSVEVAHPGFAKLQQHWLRQGDEERTTIQLEKGGVITGSLVVKETGEPMGNMMLGLVAQRGGWRSITVGNDGAFSFEGLLPGSYRIQMLPQSDESRPYLLLSPQSLSVAAGETREETIYLEKGVHVSGTVVDASTGKTPEGRTRLAFRKASDIVSGTVPGPEGAWSIYLLPGTYDILCTYEGPPASMRRTQVETITVEKDQELTGITIKIGE